MQQIAVYVFGSSVLVILYVLFGYPLLLALLSLRPMRGIQRAWIPRTVSVVIPVHNGEAWIRSKLGSLARLDYPRDLLDIVFIDDGSTDRTAELVRELAGPNVELLSIPRGGKAAALNAGISRAHGEILLFTDIRQRLDSGSLRSLVECFADPSVGVVSGELIILSGETQAEANIGLYWNYEKWIRKRLSRLDSVLGATGCLYAMRRELAVTLPPDTLLDDVYLPLAAFFKGYRVIFEEGARAFDYPTALKSEFWRKVRTQAGVYQIAAAYPRLLLPTTRMWLHFVSHKLGRLMLPYALILVAISTFALPQPWKLAAIIAQACFYALAALDGWMPRPIKRVSSLARTFVVLVTAALCAPVVLASNRRRTAGWKTTEVRPAVVGDHLPPPPGAAAESHTSHADYLRTDDLKDGLSGRTARGGAITIVAQAVKFAAGIATTVILARLLTPEDYGLVGMVAAVTGFIAIFKDLGLSAATIQKAELNDRQIATLFWINVVFGLGLMAATAVLAPAIAWFYGEPRLVNLTLAYAAGFLFGGVTVQHEALLRRRMRFGALAVAELGSLSASAVAAVVLAWLGARYWALVGAQLVQGCTYAVFVWFSCRWRPGWPARNSGVRSLIAFGRNLTGFSVVNYFARNLDNILLGRYWGSTELGLYARAYQLLLFPIDQINAPISSVAVPALSRLVDSPERYRSAYLRLLEKVALLTMPLMAFMIMSCDWIVLVVLGPKWVGVTRIFAMLGIVGFVQPVCNTTGWLFITQNRTHHMLQWGGIGSAIIVASILAGLAWGATGVATSYSIVFLTVVTPLLLWFVGRHGPVRTRDIYAAIVPSLFAALTSLAALLIFRWQVSPAHPLVGIFLSLLVTLACTLSCLALLPAGRRSLQDLRGLIENLLRNKFAIAS